MPNNPETHEDQTSRDEQHTDGHANDGPEDRLKPTADEPDVHDEDHSPEARLHPTSEADK